MILCLVSGLLWKSHPIRTEQKTRKMLRTGCTKLLRKAVLPGPGHINRAGAHSQRRIPQTRPSIVLDGDEYSKDAEYPPIQEVSFTANLMRKHESWYDHIQKLNTVEEKQIALNMPRYYGYKCLLLPDDKFHYNCLPFVQHSTRTALRTTGLPEYYEPLRVRADKHLASIREDIESAITFESVGYK